MNKWKSMHPLLNKLKKQYPTMTLIKLDKEAHFRAFYYAMLGFFLLKK